MHTTRPSFFKRLIGYIVPQIPDFHALLNEQVAGVVTAAELLVRFMETGAREVSSKILKQEHLSDDIKVRNLQILSDAFSTQMDRENIYRAIIGLDEVVNYGKTTVKEVEALGVQPGQHELVMAMRIRDGMLALRDGYAHLPKASAEAAKCCSAARKSERLVERAYRQALTELFQGSDYINMFKRREIYRHLSNTADRVATGAGHLNDIIVKMG
ncbi:MAG: DUF47 family protein [Spartobacteria bacterium]